MYQSIVYVKLKSMVQSTPVNPTVFVKVLLATYNVTNHVSQLRFNVCTQIEAALTNGKKTSALGDVTKHSSFTK